MVLGIIGVIVAIALLIFMAFKRWNLIVVSILAAIVAGLANKFGFWSIFSDYYMPGAVGFIKSWFLVFTIGAIYSEFMTRSGSVVSIAYKLVDWFGKKNVILVMLIVCILLNLGGINPYVQIFILWPICVVFSKEADIPRGIWLGIFYLGMFTASNFPGNPSMANTIASQMLGVSPSSQPIISVAIFLLYLAIGYLYFAWLTKRWKTKGVHYVQTERDSKTSAVSRENCPAFIKSIIPMVIVLVLYSGLTAGWFKFMGLQPIAASNSILAAMFIASLVCFALNYKLLKKDIKDILIKGSSGGVNPTIVAAVITGFVSVVIGSPAYAGFVSAIQNLGGHPYMQVLISGNIITFITGSAAVATTTVLNTFSASWLSAGVSAAVLRPLVVLNVSGFSLPPHSGGLAGVMDFAGTDLKESYLPCVCGVMLPSIITSVIITVVLMIIA